MARAPALQAGGREFEPRRIHKNFKKMTLTLAIIIIVVYLLIAFIVYKKYMADAKQPEWEKILLSIAWILLLPLWLIHKLHML